MALPAQQFNKYSTLQYVFDHLGVTKIAEACNITRTPAGKWLRNGLPMSDLTGETDYATRIEFAAAKAGVEVSAIELIRERLADIKPGIEYRIPVELFQPDQTQPRKQFDQAKLDSLAATLKIDGQETPVKVSVDPALKIPLIITHGERRWRAANIAGIETLRCMLDDKTGTESEAQRIFRQAADNTGEPLTKWDMACTIRDLSERLQMKDQEISDQLTQRGFVGYSRPVVANLRRLFKLPFEAQRLIESAWLTPSHGKYLLATTHKKTLEQVITVLCTNNGHGEEPPTTTHMNNLTMAAYRDNCRGLTTYCNGYGYPRFDWESECQGCQHKHKFDSHHFCGNSTCWDKKQADEDTSQAELREQRDEIVDRSITAIKQGEEPPETNDPEIKKQIDEEIKWKQRSAQQSTRREHLLAYTKAVEEALRSADRSVLIAILIADQLIDEAHPEELSFAGVVERVKLDPDGMLLRLAVDWMESEEVGQYLAIDHASITPPPPKSEHQDPPETNSHAV